MAAGSARLALLAYDGSDGAREAIRRSAPLLRTQRVLVASVFGSLGALFLPGAPRALPGLLRDARAELDEEDRREGERIAAEGAALASEAGLEAQALAVEGPAKVWPTLLALAREHDAAVLVVGARGTSGVASALLGSAAEGVLQHARLPVLVVPRGEPAGAPASGPLLLAVDGSTDAQHAVERGVGLLASRSAVAVTVWVSAREVAPAAALGAPAAVLGEAVERVDAELESEAAHVAEAAAAVARAAGIEASARAAQSRGSVWARLCELAREHDVAAIALGSHGHGRVVSALLGSVSRGVVHHSPAPVLVVPHERDEPDR